MYLFTRPPKDASIREYVVEREIKTKTSWSESASELYRPSDRRLSAK
jgi:hypothetical protein